MLIALLALAAAPELANLPPDFALSEETPLIQFAYSWPARVEAVPALRTAMRAEMARDRARTRAEARQAEIQARRGRYPFNRHSFGAAWTVEGDSAQLISLSAEVETYTGGGHSEHNYDTLLWDVAARRRVAMPTLFGPAAVGVLSQRFCPAFEAARIEHYGGERSSEDSDCPALADRAAAPADRDSNGRFDTYRAYINTGYFDTEGYTVDLPLRAEDVARIPAAYRSVFEAAPQP